MDTDMSLGSTHAAFYQVMLHSQKTQRLSLAMLGEVEVKRYNRTEVIKQTLWTHELVLRNIYIVCGDITGAIVEIVFAIIASGKMEIALAD